MGECIEFSKNKLKILFKKNISIEKVKVSKEKQSSSFGLFLLHFVLKEEKSSNARFLLLLLLIKYSQIKTYKTTSILLTAIISIK